MIRETYSCVLQIGYHREILAFVCVLHDWEKSSREIAIVSFSSILSLLLVFITIGLDRAQRQTLLVGMARNLLKISSISALLGAESAIFDVLSTCVTIKFWDAWRKLVAQR